MKNVSGYLHMWEYQKVDPLLISKNRFGNASRVEGENALMSGKEIIIKAIAQAIPTFAMGCFELTKSLCDQISSMISMFWWNQQEGKHKIHWFSW